MMVVKRALRGFHHRVAKRFHAVADRFDAGHGRASAGKRLEQEPEADRGGRKRQSRRNNDGGGMTARGQSVLNSPIE